MQTKSEQIIEVLEIQNYITRKEVNEICEGWRYTCWVINSIRKKWHKLIIKRDPLTNDPIKYIYKWYKKPFYKISRDIELNYPKMEKTIRSMYYLICKKWK